MKGFRFLIILVALFMLTACEPSAPKVGTVFTVPDGITAYYVNADESGLNSCTIPAQDVIVIRNTYWATYQGAIEKYDYIYISEISAEETGSCGGEIFLKDEVINGLIEK